MVEQHDVVVVGAGLAGLACARALPRHLDVLVLEAGDAVGGRVRTDRVDGYLLDRGFQVLNTGYPELRRTVDLEALDLRAFSAAVGLQLDGRRRVLGNPFLVPSSIRDAVTLPVGGWRGKAALASYAAQCLALPASRLRAREDVSAREAWRRAGIPEEVVDQVLRAFFGGVVLEQEMATSRRFTDLMVKMFVRGASTVPARGMQALPELMASDLPEGSVRLDTAVRRVTGSAVATDDGEVRARAVVLAADGWDAAGLLDGVGAPPARGVTTIYHAAPAFPTASTMLLLDQHPSPIANTLAVSQAAPTYAPPGRVLVATSLVHPVTEDPDGQVVRSRLAALHQTDTSSWEAVATYRIDHALPGMAAPHAFRRPARVGSGREAVHVAGDHRDTSSIQGALVSGRRVAQAVLEDLRRSR
jgi:phytoene dehydrogenase-like protein